MSRRPRIRRTLRSLPSLLLLAAAGSMAVGAGADQDQGAVPPLAVLADERVTESSGLAASGRTPELLWTHNDSGGGPILYATDRAGRALGRFAVTGATNVDWEDLAAGPGVDGTPALYVADIGDNARVRDDLAVYRVAEPAVDVAEPPPVGEVGVTAPAERFPFAYPDGRHNAETLLLDPRTADLYVVTKAPGGHARIYRFPLPMTAGRTATLEAVGSLALPGILGATGGSVAPDGGMVVVRTYAAAFAWAMLPDETLADALRGGPRRVALPPMRQGEAVAFREDGRALLLTGEGSPCPLSEVALGRDNRGAGG